MSSEELKDRLIQAVANMAELPDSDKVNIKGKYYAEVHTRVQAFREAYGEDGKIISQIHVADETKVLAETTVSVIVDGSWRQLANDYAEEFRGSGMVNKTSCVENCLTSSIGRALSACGLSGGNYASFDEVNHAIHEKEEAPAKEVIKKEKVKVVDPAFVAANMIRDTIKGNDSDSPAKDEKKLEDFDYEGTAVNINDEKGASWLCDQIFESIKGFSDDVESLDKIVKANRPTFLEIHKKGYPKQIHQLKRNIDELKLFYVNNPGAK